MQIVGFDCGSTTVKANVLENGQVLWKDYRRHDTKIAETALDFFARMEAEIGLTPKEARVYITGSMSGPLAPLIGAKQVQEVVAVAAAVERLHPEVMFVSEIGGEDMKTIFFTRMLGIGKSKQVMMQSACAGGTGNFIEKTARKLGVMEGLPEMGYRGYALHKVSPKCGIFAEADANTLVKAGVPVEEIIASLFEAVVYQNLATLTRGNTPMPEVLLLGGPNLFFKGLQEAWRHHLVRLWTERKVALPAAQDPESLIRVPQEALYYPCLGCAEIAQGEPPGVGIYHGTERLQWWIATGQYEQKKKEGGKGLWVTVEDLEHFKHEYAANGNGRAAPNGDRPRATTRAVCGMDFGSTTAKFVLLSPEQEILATGYTLSHGNPIEDAKTLFRQVQQAMGNGEILAVSVTGYGKDLLIDIIGADVPVVETVAHATAGLHFFPDADCICDVGGVDVKIMILRQGTVSDFRLNSQCSSGNGAFLQGVAERFAIPLDEMADRAFQAQAKPTLSMGCGVFLQSDIVNQQRKGWQAEEILAGLCGILPLNVWVYAGGLTNLGQVGRKFILQGGTHRNLAVVKAQVDFIRSKIPDAEIVVHPYSGEAGAIGAALVALAWWRKGNSTHFRGFDTIESLTYRTITSLDTICRWCPVNCKRSFVDVEVPGGKGRTWSKVPLSEGWERVIVNNSCPKGLVEDANEMRVIKADLDKTKAAFPNIGEHVRHEAFRPPRSFSPCSVS
ncbi:MAG: BadF/BadG/BcrA/BcrD ATPase family protein [Candidatus Methylomirabilales bacterium]